jgi:hypothetical protein
LIPQHKRATKEHTVSNSMPRHHPLLALAFALAFITGCRTTRPGAPLARTGDEIVVAGKFFHPGTPVVT